MNNLLVFGSAAFVFLCLLAEIVENWRRIAALEQRIEELEKKIK